MNSDNPLDPVYKAFSVASDCFKVATRTIQVQHEELIRRTQFIGATEEEANTVLQDAAKQAADLAIIALFATFERFVIEASADGEPFACRGIPAAERSRISPNLQYSTSLSNFSASLAEYFKGEVDADLIGQVKQIKQYRDWIAHQNPNKPTPTQATPETAFDVLTRMIEQIRLTHTPPAEQEAAEAAIG